MFHVLTGCDTVSSFAGHGNKTALVNIEFTARRDRCTTDLVKWTYQTIERFVILLSEHVPAVRHRKSHLDKLL